MASTYKDPNQQAQTTPQYTSTAKGVTTSGSGNALQRVSGADNYTGMLGLSSQTQSNLGKLQQGYVQSDAVTNAQRYLDNIQANKPGDYQSRYTEQLNQLFDQIQNRPQFEYDLNGDMLWQQYKDQYMQTGKQAMADSIAQASALTGGYGNSYAASVGNQAYQQYLRDMTGIIPDLYDRAAARYDQAGQDLYNRYSLAQQADNTDYGRYQDQLTQWNADRDYGANWYNAEYNRDYGQYSDMLNYWNGAANQENAQYMTNRQYAYNLATSMLAAGSMPSDDMLAQAGISKADADSLLHPQVVTQVVYRKRPTDTGDLITVSNGAGGTTQTTVQNKTAGDRENSAYQQLLKDRIANRSSIKNTGSGR